MRTVGRVDATFWGWGGRMVTGTHPEYTQATRSVSFHTHFLENAKEQPKEPKTETIFFLHETKFFSQRTDR